MAGVTQEGFTIETLEDIRKGINKDLQVDFGSANLGEKTFVGQLVGVVSDRIASLWEASEATYNARDPQRATGDAQIVNALITGTIPKLPSPSKVTLYLTGTAATTIPLASEANESFTGAVFETLSEVTLTDADLMLRQQSYIAGDVARNADDQVYLCSVAGVTGVASEPIGESIPQIDGGTQWVYLGEGPAFAQVPAESQENGPIKAVAYSLTDIGTAVSGWTHVQNPEDASLGSDTETDAELRQRREDEISGSGEKTLAKIRKAVLDLANVTAVRIFNNPTDTTDADGVTPHSIEAVVSGGDDQQIRDAIISNIAGGTGTHGTTSGNATDSEGSLHEIKFSRPVELEIWVEIDLIKTPESYPNNGDDLVKEALTTAEQTTGVDAVASRLSKLVFVTGVIDVSAVRIGLASGPTTSTTVPVSLRQFADYDTSRIIVNSTDGTP